MFYLLGVGNLRSVYDLWRLWLCRFSHKQISRVFSKSALLNDLTELMIGVEVQSMSSSSTPSSAWMPQMMEWWEVVGNGDASPGAAFGLSHTAAHSKRQQLSLRLLSGPHRRSAWPSNRGLSGCFSSPIRSAGIQWRERGKREVFVFRVAANDLKCAGDVCASDVCSDFAKSQRFV